MGARALSELWISFFEKNIVITSSQIGQTTSRYAELIEFTAPVFFFFLVFYFFLALN